jgi:hypothetical protein
MAAHPVSPPPFRFDPRPSWLADDFFVAAANDWQTVRASLLAAVEQTGLKSGAERLVMVSARTDEPKRAMLAELGYQRGASWWVHPIQAFEGERTTLRDTDAVVGPGPPIYDPGGLATLAIEMRDPADVATFDRSTTASNAILAIVPAGS